MISIRLTVLREFTVNLHKPSIQSKFEPFSTLMFRNPMSQLRFSRQIFLLKGFQSLSFDRLRSKNLIRSDLKVILKLRKVAYLQNELNISRSKASSG
jgi:hypothetical protein